MPDLLTDAPPAEIARVPADPMLMLSRLIENGVEPDKLGQMLDFVERVSARRAAERFADAFANIQAEMPAVLKWRESGGDGAKLRYKFASLDDVMAAAGPVMARHGMTASFDTEHETEKTRGMLKVVVRLRVGSHFEDKSFMTPIPAMTVNDTQKFGAALTYAKRYALCAALNIVTTDHDTDAADLVQELTEGERDQIQKLMDEKRVNLKMFWPWVSEQAGFKVEALADIPRAAFSNILGKLKQKESPK